MSTRRTLWFVALAGAAAGAAVAGVACLDLTPSIYEAPASGDGQAPMPDVVVMESMPPGDGGQGDAAIDGDASAPEVVVPPTCVGCLNTPDDAASRGCATELGACLANAECASTYHCCVAHGCFQQPTFRDIVNCGIPCAEEAGIVSQQDPAVMLIYGIAVCASCNCNGICAIGDAGPGCGD